MCCSSKETCLDYVRESEDPLIHPNFHNTRKYRIEVFFCERLRRSTFDVVLDPAMALLERGTYLFFSSGICSCCTVMELKHAVCIMIDIFCVCTCNVLMTKMPLQ